MSTNKIIFQNAFLIYSLIVVYFLLMKLFGLDNVSELRFLNFLFVFWGVNRAIKMNLNYNTNSTYFNSFYAGFGSSVIGVGLTIIGLIVYVGFMDPEFITVLENSSLWGKKLSLQMVVFALAIEGIASSVMCSFIVMQYYKSYKSSKMMV